MMGREVRKVPADWKHPKHMVTDWRNGLMVERYKPLHDGYYAEAAKNFMDKANAEGLEAATDYYGDAPKPDDYMPDWPADQRTHFMMYEDTSEGTPISPAFATPEELARWLADTGASSFGDMTATYEQWLRVANGGFACSLVVHDGIMESGVAAL